MAFHACVCLLLLMLAFPLDAQTKDPKSLVGETGTVCGPVVTFTVTGKDGAGCTVRLDLAGPVWRPVFYARIPPESWPSFSPSPERKYMGQEVCVTGSVALDKSRVPYIVVTSADQIKQTSAREIAGFANDVPRACETGMVAPKLVKSFEAVYPRNLLIRGVGGQVLVQAVVGTDGRVSETRIIFADEGFGAAGEAAVKQWRFTPGTRNAVPVPVVVEIRVNFTRR